MRIIKFGLVSGTGLLIDFCIFKALTSAGLPPIWANTISAAVAVTFVFFVSVRKVFYAGNQFILAKFLIYLAYQAGAILLASWCIGLLSGENGPVIQGRHIPPLVAKALVTPFTFYTNFLFMGWLVTGRLRLL